MLVVVDSWARGRAGGDTVCLRTMGPQAKETDGHRDGGHSPWAAPLATVSAAFMRMFLFFLSVKEPLVTL